MGQKDLAEKQLEDYNDVFADILNVLLYTGDRIVDPSELQEADPRSRYMTKGSYHELERDVAKYWNQCNIHIAFYGIENQTEQDYEMPMRLIGYDGSAYRSQLLRIKDSEKNGGDEPEATEYVETEGDEPVETERGEKEGDVHGDRHEKEVDAAITDTKHPVFTLVLYFGYEHHWTAPTHLLDCFPVPDRLKPFINDYPIHVFEIAFLDRETVDKFTSDFWFVADFFWQLRNNGTYVPSPEQITHVQAVLQAMSALTGDKRFTELWEAEDRREGNTMLEYLDQLIAKGEAKGEESERSRIQDMINERLKSGMKAEEILEEIKALKCERRNTPSR